MIGLHYYTKYTKEKIKLSAKPFAGGGEGNLYKIASPRNLSHLVAKIYHPQKRSKIREQKLVYLMKNPPKGYIVNEHPNIIWVTEVIYEDESHDFAGILMPIAKGIKLENFTSNRLPRQLGSDWDRFRFQHPEALAIRQKVAFNIAAAIHLVHQKERYVLVDLKPDNILIQPNGLISLVDMDSIEVVENGKSIYDAPVATPEFIPPEHYRKDNLDYIPTTQKTWDLFGLGAILYKLFLGIHPYAASARPPHDHLVSLEDKIQAGLFVHDPSKRDLFFIIPPPHKVFYDLDERIQDLFYSCFIHGYHKPTDRPTADQWCNILSTILGINRDQLIVRVLPKIELPIEHQVLYKKLGTTEVFEVPNIQKLLTPTILSKQTISMDSIDKAKKYYLDSIRAIKTRVLFLFVLLGSVIGSSSVALAFYLGGNMLLLAIGTVLSLPLFLLLTTGMSYLRYALPQNTKVQKQTLAVQKILETTYKQLLEVPNKFTQYQSTFDQLSEINQFIQEKKQCQQELKVLQSRLEDFYNKESSILLQLEANYHQEIEANKILGSLNTHNFNELQSKLQQRLNKLALLGQLVDESQLQQLKKLSLRKDQELVEELYQQLQQIHQHHKQYYSQKELQIKKYPKNKIDPLVNDLFKIPSPSSWLKPATNLTQKYTLDIPSLLEQRQQLQTKIKLYFAETDRFFIDFLETYGQFKEIIKEHEDAKKQSESKDKSIKTDQWESFADRMQRKHQQNLLKQALLKQQKESPQLISQIENKLEKQLAHFQQSFNDFQSSLQELNAIHNHFLQLVEGNEVNRKQQLTQIKTTLSFLKASYSKQLNNIRSDKDVLMFKSILSEGIEHLQKIYERYQQARKKNRAVFDQHFSSILNEANSTVNLLLGKFHQLNLGLLESEEINELKQLIQETQEKKKHYQEQGADLMEWQGKAAWEKQKTFGFWLKILFSKLPPTE
ncbi:MAG: hypothetical protein MK212_01130 [Saprospiraceae bacterium]|nr:hypothetical protein [Saprospiraceae bacterium]